MRPIVYNGVDLSGVCSAEVIEKVALPVEAETLAHCWWRGGCPPG